MHEKRQEAIELLTEELEKRDRDLLKIQTCLKEAESNLTTAIFQANQKLKSMSQANERKLSSEELIRYAHRISAANSVAAPLNWQPGDPERPYPLDHEMKLGWLQRMHSGGPLNPSAPAGSNPGVQMLAPGMQAPHNMSSDLGSPGFGGGNFGQRQAFPSGMMPPASNIVQNTGGFAPPMSGGPPFGSPKPSHSQQYPQMGIPWGSPRPGLHGNIQQPQSVSSMGGHPSPRTMQRPLTPRGQTPPVSGGALANQLSSSSIAPASVKTDASGVDSERLSSDSSSSSSSDNSPE